MDIFTDGRKVSEKNIVINEDDTPMDNTSMNMLIGTITPQRMLMDVKNDPIYEEFLQYITMAGHLNLRLIAPN